MPNFDLDAVFFISCATDVFCSRLLLSFTTRRIKRSTRRSRVRHVLYTPSASASTVSPLETDRNGAALHFISIPFLTKLFIYLHDDDLPRQALTTSLAPQNPNRRVDRLDDRVEGHRLGALRACWGPGDVSSIESPNGRLLPEPFPVVDTLRRGSNHATKTKLLPWTTPLSCSFPSLLESDVSFPL